MRAKFLAALAAILTVTGICTAGLGSTASAAPVAVTHAAGTHPCDPGPAWSAGQSARHSGFLPARAEGKCVPPAGGVGGYSLIDDWATITTAPTSGSVVYTYPSRQGIVEADGAFISNHSLQDFLINGSCDGNSKCLSQSNPDTIEITFSTGQNYCGAGLFMCYAVFPWRNGNFFVNNINGNTSNPYVEASGGTPNDGTWHPIQDGTTSTTVGYSLSYGRINLVINGVIQGWIPTSFWGQTTFGPVTAEYLQGEVYENSTDWTHTPKNSMDYTWSSFTDSAGNTLPTSGIFSPQPTNGYTVSNVSATGFTTDGGTDPTDAGTNWPVELSLDNSMCLDNTGNSGTNGNKVQIWACNGGQSQQWHWNSSTGEIVNQNGKCLDDTAGGGNGTQLQIYTCNDGANQVWSTAGNNDFQQFCLYSQNECLDDPGSSTHNGDKMQVWNSNGNNSQQQDPGFSLL